MQFLLPALGLPLGGATLDWPGTLVRIVPFLGVGSLLLLIGYLAPTPPRRRPEAP